MLLLFRYPYPNHIKNYRVDSLELIRTHCLARYILFRLQSNIPSLSTLVNTTFMLLEELRTEPFGSYLSRRLTEAEFELSVVARLGCRLFVSECRHG